MSHQDLSSIEIQTNEAYNQFDSLQPRLPQDSYLDQSNYEPMDTPEELTQLSNQELSSIEIQTNEAYSQSTSLQPQLFQDFPLLTQLSDQELSSIEIQTNEAYSQSTGLQPHLSQDLHLDQPNYEQLDTPVEDQSNYEPMDTPEEVTQLSNQELSSVEIQTNEAYSQSTSLQPHLSQDFPLLTQLSDQELSSIEIQTNEAYSQSTGLQPHLSQDFHLDQPNYEQLDTPVEVPYFVQWQVPQTLGQQNLAPIQTQPVNFHPVTVVLQEQENVTQESSDVKCLNKECFAAVSVSIMLMIIFLIFGGPLTLAGTISGMICLIRASQRSVDNKKKELNEWGLGLHLLTGAFVVFWFPIWGCAVGCLVFCIIIL